MHPALEPGVGGFCGCAGPDVLVKGSLRGEICWPALGENAAARLLAVFGRARQMWQRLPAPTARKVCVQVAARSDAFVPPPLALELHALLKAKVDADAELVETIGGLYPAAVLLFRFCFFSLEVRWGRGHASSMALRIFGFRFRSENCVIRVR